MLLLSTLLGLSLAAKPEQTPTPEDQGTKSELEDLFSTPPTDGVHRCRTPEGRRDPHDVAMWSWVYLGGPQPGPGMLTNHIRIFVDGEELWSRETRVDRPLADPTMITWGPATMSKAIPDPTQGEEVIPRRSDGKPILPGEQTLRVTWVCELGSMIARP